MFGHNEEELAFSVESCTQDKNLSDLFSDTNMEKNTDISAFFTTDPLTDWLASEPIPAQPERKRKQVMLEAPPLSLDTNKCAKHESSTQVVLPIISQAPIALKPTISSVIKAKKAVNLQDDVKEKPSVPSVIAPLAEILQKPLSPNDSVYKMLYQGYAFPPATISFFNFQDEFISQWIKLLCTLPDLAQRLEKLFSAQPQAKCKLLLPDTIELFTNQTLANLLTGHFRGRDIEIKIGDYSGNLTSIPFKKMAILEGCHSVEFCFYHEAIVRLFMREFYAKLPANIQLNIKLLLNLSKLAQETYDYPVKRLHLTGQLLAQSEPITKAWLNNVVASPAELIMLDLKTNEVRIPKMHVELFMDLFLAKLSIQKPCIMNFIPTGKKDSLWNVSHHALIKLFKQLVLAVTHDMVAINIGVGFSKNYNDNQDRIAFPLLDLVLYLDKMPLKPHLIIDLGGNNHRQFKQVFAEASLQFTRLVRDRVIMLVKTTEKKLPHPALASLQEYFLAATPSPENLLSEFKQRKQQHHVSEQSQDTHKQFNKNNPALLFSASTMNIVAPVSIEQPKL